MSRGPWLGAGVGALVVFLGRARNRTKALVVTALVILSSRVSLRCSSPNRTFGSNGTKPASVMEESAAYRHELLQRYIAIVEESPVWGWGRNNFPTVNGMKSIDNQYLLLALTYGEYALALFAAIIVCTMVRLVGFCRTHQGSAFPGSIALTLLGCFVTIAVTITTVALLWQAVQLLFLTTGWSEAVALGRTQEQPLEVVEKPSSPLLFKRVMV